MPNPAEFHVAQVSVTGPTVQVVVEGELDAHAAPVFETSMAQLRAKDHTNVVIDVAKLEFIDSTGLHALVRADTTFREAGGEIRLVNPSDLVLRVLQIADLDEHFGVDPAV